MDRNRIIGMLGQDWTRVQGIIRKALHSDVDLLERTNESILSNSGKQLRLMMSLLMARACGRVNERSYDYAAASEMLHNATLIHDDVADESRERRGRPTVMSLLGPSAAVLLGDFWLARSMDQVLKSGTDDSVISIFSKTLTDLAEGEMLQLEKASSGDTTIEDYLRIIYCKTASLFEAACVTGAISVGAPDSLVKAAKEYARNMGLAFQIKDDILDYDGDQSLGKPVGVDIKEQKITLPLLGAMLLSGREDIMRERVRNIHEHPEQCEEVRKFVIENGGIEYASERLEGFIDNAILALSPLPASAEKDMLCEIARYNSARKV